MMNINGIPVINDNWGLIFDENKNPVCAYDNMERWNNGVAHYEPSPLLNTEERREVNQWADEWGKKREKTVMVVLGLFEKTLKDIYPNLYKKYMNEFRQKYPHSK